MCVISTKLSKVKTGYKVMGMRGEKFYSTFTGQEMSIGKVQLPPKYTNKIYRGWLVYNRKLFEDNPIYMSNIVGKSSAFLNKIDAEDLFKNHKKNSSQIKRGFKLVLVKISFRGDVYEGTYGFLNNKIIIGDTIRSIKIVS